MTTVTILKTAREHIQKYGWTQGEYGRLTGPCCIAGSVFVTHPTMSLNLNKPFVFLQKAIGADSIPAWNDTSGRTVEEVLAVFDRAIALAEAETK